jgi:hypothetical protein
LFTLIISSSAVIDYLWERAVLSKGLYFTKASAGRWNMLSTRLAKNNIERDHSWRRLLRLSVSSESEWEKRQGYVKSVFDDAHFEVNDVEGSLRCICDKALADPAIEDWRKAFIKHSTLFKECNQGFIAKNDSEIILLHESQRNHYHSELYTRALDLELKQKSEQLLPFKQLQYKPVRSREESPYVALGQWVYKDKKYNIKIWFCSDVYKLLFYTSEPHECAGELIGILEKHGFKVTYDNQYSSYLNSCKTQEEAFDILMGLCSGLRGLVDE